MGSRRAVDIERGVHQDGNRAEDLRHFYRIINTDERASAVLKRAAP
jgi:hypothetical protein